MAYTSADIQMVDDHIAQGERHVTRQKELVAWLKSRDLPTAQAEQLLDQFKGTLSQHRAHRDKMIRDVAPL